MTPLRETPAWHVAKWGTLGGIETGVTTGGRPPAGSERMPSATARAIPPGLHLSWVGVARKTARAAEHKSPSADHRAPWLQPEHRRGVSRVASTRKMAN